MRAESRSGSSSRSASDPDPLRVVERFPGDVAADPGAKDVDLDRRALRAARRDVGERDRLLHAVAVAAAGHPANHLAIDANRLRTQGDRSRVIEHKTSEP